MKIGLMIKNDAHAIKKSKELTAWFKSNGVETFCQTSNSSVENILQKKKVFNAPDNLSCVFVLGGDGTFLNAVRWIADKNFPILGVKFGNIGFLADTAEENLFSVAENVLNGKYYIEHRSRLKASILRDNEIITTQIVLNDIVINKGALARLANILTYVNDNYLTTYRADGLIVATPTGSTAYSLAAGGPIVYPDVECVILTPICPFTLTNRPLIIPDSSTIKIKLTKDSTDIMVTFDGQLGLEITSRDSLIIKKYKYPLSIIKIPNQNYFDVLKKKLQWSGGR